MEVSTWSYPDSERLFFGQMLARSLENSIYEKDFNPKKYTGAYIPPKYVAPDRKEVDNDEKESSKPNASLLFYHGGLLCQRIVDLLNDNRKIDWIRKKMSCDNWLISTMSEIWLWFTQKLKSADYRYIELCCELSHPIEIIRFIEEGSGNSYR